MGKHNLISRNTPLDGKEIETLYDIVSAAVKTTDFKNKSTDEIFGEIFTRFRSEIAIYGRHDNFRVFQRRLKDLDTSTEYAKILNSIINELYLDKFSKECGVDDVELSAIAMESCLSELKDVNNESKLVATNLDKINKEYINV
jgi:hypothetical protein